MKSDPSMARNRMPRGETDNGTGGYLERCVLGVVWCRRGRTSAIITTIREMEKMLLAVVTS